MNYLLDTHTFLWFIAGNPNLSEKAKEIIEVPENRRFLSIASVWEISIKTSLKKLEINLPLNEFLSEQFSINSIELLDMNFEHVTNVVNLPFFHNDPFDRILISQAIIEKIPIISCDIVFDKYPISRIW